MNSLRNYLRQNKLLRNVLQVIGGNSIAQLAVLLAAPIITRIYSPEVFGMQGAFLSVVALLAPLIALRYPMAIVVSRSNREIRQAEQSSVLVAGITCTLIFFALLVFQESLGELLGLSELGLLLLLTPVMLFFTAMQEIADYKAARQGLFRAVSIVTAVQAVVINGSRIVVGLFAPVAVSLVVISTAGPAFHSIVLSRFLNRPRSERRLPIDTWYSLKRFMIARKDFPLLRASADFMNAASQALPVILLTTFSGPAIAGFYTLARSILNLPINVIGNAIGNVFYAHFAERMRMGTTLTGTLIKSTLLLLSIAGIPIISVCYFSPQIFSFVFGAQWREAGVYAQWMSIWIVVALANVPAVRIAPVINRQGVLLISHISTLVLRVGSMVIAHLYTGDPLIVVISFSIASAIGNLGLITALILYAFRFDKNNNGMDSHAK